MLVGKISFCIFLVVVSNSPASATCEMEFLCHDHQINEYINTRIDLDMSAHYTYLYMAQLFDQHKMNLPKVAKYFRAKSTEEHTRAEKFIEYQNQRGGTVDVRPVVRYQQGNCIGISDVREAFLCAMELEAYVTKKLTKLHRDAANLVLTRNSDGEVTCTHAVEIQQDDLRFTQPILITTKKTFNKGQSDQRETEEVISDYKQCDVCAEDESNCEKTVVSFNYVELADMIVHDFLHHQAEDTKETTNHYNTLKKMFEGKTNTRLESWLFDQHLEL